MEQLRAQSNANYPSALETKFKRIFDQCVSLLGTNELTRYINELLLVEDARVYTKTERDESPSQRQGFPKDVAIDLLYMEKLNQRVMFLTKSDGDGSIEYRKGTMELSVLNYGLEPGVNRNAAQK